MAHSIIRGLLSQATGGLAFNGQAPQIDDSGNQTAMWNPNDAENAFLSDNFGQDAKNIMGLRNGGIAKKAISSLGTLFSNNENDAGPFVDAD